MIDAAGIFRHKYRCEHCGATYDRYQIRCAECCRWGTILQDISAELRFAEERRIRAPRI
ncbi:MAG: hypothetical protein ACE5HV_05175 [Acidobacteriota bacterium]